jgi:hypothetical protein
VHAVGYYDDDFVRLAGVWRITGRRFTMVHLDLGT